MASDKKDGNLEELRVVESIQDGKIVDSKRVDEALYFLDHNRDVNDSELPAVDEKKLMRKVDWMLMPLMFACYYLQYSDKTLR